MATEAALLARGQGATEYLVLLGAVLIIAIVSIALLGFFPGMASEAQEAESMSYWRSAAPIAIVEWEAQSWWWVDSRYSGPVLRIRNTGNYPITLNKMLGEDQYISKLWSPGSGNQLMSSYPGLNQIAPGEEVTLGSCGYPGGPSICYGFVVGIKGASWCTTTANYLCAAKSGCTAQGSATNPNLGFVWINGFGFEYIEYVDNNPITKRQVGSVPLVIKCTYGP